MGIRFDIVISSYILLLPYIVFSVFSVWKDEIGYFVKKAIAYYIITLTTLAFIVCAADIPYFNQFFSRFSVMAFEWIDNPIFVSKMIIQEPKYWWVIIPLLLIVWLFIRFINKNIRDYSENNSNRYIKVVLYVVGLGLILLGIRGRIEEKSPIRVGTAYFCNNAFLNQLGLNPNFTLINSYIDSRKTANESVKFMSDSLAIKKIQDFYDISTKNLLFPTERNVIGSIDSIKRHNVVVIIMESMSAENMKRNGNNKNITPFLDSLSEEGLYFDNAYSAGIHTFNGVFSTIFSLPTLYKQNIMKKTPILRCGGLFSNLKKKGYSTIYFTTHDGQFDNIEGFLKANDCERVVSKDDYPSDKIKTTLGDHDDNMFEFSIPILSNIKKPFVAVFMTASNHCPYYIPSYFSPHNKTDLKAQAVEYADYSLKKYIYMAKREKWFNNTLFVFIADHGAAIDITYDMPLSYNHIPLLFYAPNIIKKDSVFKCPAGQIDVMPTIMGLLGFSYRNNTMGIDLLKEKRPYVFFTSDDKYGVIGNGMFLVVRNDKDESKYLYNYTIKDKYNWATEKYNIVKEMDNYAKVNFQIAQYIMTNMYRYRYNF